MNGPLLRTRYDRKIGGVCGAFARAYGWDLTAVRLVTVALAFFVGGGFLAYIICWIVIPEEPVVPASYPAPYTPTQPPTYTGNEPPAA